MVAQWYTENQAVDDINNDKVNEAATPTCRLGMAMMTVMIAEEYIARLRPVTEGVTILRAVRQWLSENCASTWRGGNIK